MTLTRRTFTALLGASLVPSALVAAEKLSLRDISRYLNSLSTVRGGFTQITEDGAVTTGTIYIHRPGRVRFEYNPPEAALVMAGGGQVAIFDPKSNQPPEQYPLRRTPLNLILKRNVNLSREGMVVGHDFDGTTTSVSARDPDNPELGSIRLVFSGPPIELRQWVISNQDGSQTTVILRDMEHGATFRPSLFSIPTEVQRRGL